MASRKYSAPASAGGPALPERSVVPPGSMAHPMAERPAGPDGPTEARASRRHQAAPSPASSSRPERADRASSRRRSHGVSRDSFSSWKPPVLEEPDQPLTGSVGRGGASSHGDSQAPEPSPV